MIQDNSNLNMKICLNDTEFVGFPVKKYQPHEKKDVQFVSCYHFAKQFMISATFLSIKL